MYGSQDGSPPDDEVRTEAKINRRLQRVITVAIEEDHQARQLVEQEHDRLRPHGQHSHQHGRAPRPHGSGCIRWEKPRPALQQRMGQNQAANSPDSIANIIARDIAGLRVSTHHGAGTALPGTLRLSQQRRVEPWTGVFKPGGDLKTKCIVFKLT